MRRGAGQPASPPPVGPGPGGWGSPPSTQLHAAHPALRVPARRPPTGAPQVCAQTCCSCSLRVLIRPSPRSFVTPALLHAVTREGSRPGPQPAGPRWPSTSAPGSRRRDGWSHVPTGTPLRAPRGLTRGWTSAPLLCPTPQAQHRGLRWQCKDVTAHVADLGDGESAQVSSGSTHSVRGTEPLQANPHCPVGPWAARHADPPPAPRHSAHGAGGRLEACP